jgi:hypothetical protein
MRRAARAAAAQRQADAGSIFDRILREGRYWRAKNKKRDTNEGRSQVNQNLLLSIRCSFPSPRNVSILRMLPCL